MSDICYDGNKYMFNNSLGPGSWALFRLKIILITKHDSGIYMALNNQSMGKTILDLGKRSNECNKFLINTKTSMTS